MFSCEFCEIFKNTFFTEHLRKVAFDDMKPVVTYIRKPWQKTMKWEKDFKVSLWYLVLLPAISLIPSKFWHYPRGVLFLVGYVFKTLSNI